MMKSKRFEPIQEIIASSAEQLSRSMGESAQRVTDLERQLAQLNTYRDEYVRSAAASGATMEAARLQNYRSFLERLGEALRQQGTKLDAARTEYEKRRVQWSSKRIEAESMGRAIDRFRRHEQQVADRREQRESDDAATRISQFRTEAGNT